MIKICAKIVNVENLINALKDYTEKDELINKALTLNDKQRAKLLTEINDLDLRNHIEDIINEQRNITQFFNQNDSINTDSIADTIKSGTRINRITIERLIGQGGMGSVYQGYDEKLKRKVAIKSIRNEYLSVESTHQRFIREAQILSKINHPSICHIYDYIETDNRDYLILELIQGKQLNQVFLDYNALLKIFLELAKALKAAHKHGIVHRDLKPDNIMITKDNQVKVLDFGIAQSLSKPLKQKTNTFIVESSELTQRGSLVGTIRYMSPEQARGESITTASDIYSLGIIVQELFSHEKAYEETETAELLESVQTGQISPFKSTFKPIKNLIDKLCQLDPLKRPDASEVCFEFHKLIIAPKIKKKRNIQLSLLVLTIAFIIAIFWQWHQAEYFNKSANLAKSYTNSINQLVRESEQIYVLPLHNTKLEIADVLRRGSELFMQIENDSNLTVKDRTHLQGLIFLESEDFESAVQYLEKSGADDALLARAWIGLFIDKTSDYALSNGIVEALDSTDIREEYLVPAIKYINNSAQKDSIHEAFKVSLTESLDLGLILLNEIIQSQSWDKRAIRLKTQILMTKADQAIQKGDWETANGLYEQTNQTFEKAIDMARSYPDSYLGMCQINGIMLYDAIQRTGQDFRIYSKKANQACVNYLIAFPDNNFVINLLARIHVITAQGQMLYDEDPSLSIQSAQNWINQSKDNENNPTAIWTNALFHTIKVSYDLKNGSINNTDIDQAILLYKKAIIFAPNEPYINSDLIHAFELYAEILLRKNKDITHIIREAENIFQLSLKNPLLLAIEKRALYLNMGTLYYKQLFNDYIENTNLTTKGTELLSFYRSIGNDLKNDPNLLISMAAVNLLMTQSQIQSQSSFELHLNSAHILITKAQELNENNPQLITVLLWYKSLSSLTNNPDNNDIRNEFIEFSDSHPNNVEIQYLWANHLFLLMQKTNNQKDYNHLKQSALLKINHALKQDSTNRLYLNLERKLNKN